MPITVTGTKVLNSRLVAIRGAFKVAAADWANETVSIARSNAPVRTGHMAADIRVRSTGSTRASVKAGFPARFVEGDTREHLIRPRGQALVFKVGGRTIFTKKALRRAHRGRPFLVPAARVAYERFPVSDAVAQAWNDAG